MTDTTIEIKLDGLVQIARVSEILHPVHRMFYVTMEDGYNNIFFTDVESGKWIEQDLGFTGLAEALGTALSGFFSNKDVLQKKLTWRREYTHNTLIHFGFHHYLIRGFRIYEIYAANKRYMFTLVKLDTDLWQLFRTSCVFEWNYNQDFIEEIAFCIDSHSITRFEN